MTFGQICELVSMAITILAAIALIMQVVKHRNNDQVYIWCAIGLMVIAVIGVVIPGPYWTMTVIAMFCSLGTAAGYTIGIATTAANPPC